MRVARTGSGSRGQAIQLGALLLFAILIINLSLFQIFVVPDQNAEIEFKHSEEVRSDMLNARNAVLDAATGDQSFVEVDLAPAYPSRSLFVNPAEPSGTVRTTEARSISIVNDSVADPQTISNAACPGTSVPRTRALEYRAGYNYYDSDPTYRVEHTVLFREFPGETLPGSGQQLVTEDAINLLPLRNEFSESGTGAATVEPVPGGVLSTNVVDPEIQLPTAYSESVWEETLSGTVPESAVSVDETTDTLTLTLSGSFTLNCGPVGVNGAPPSGARAGSLFGSGGGAGGAGGSINPAGFSEVRLVSVSDVGSNSDIQITLKNTDDEAKSLARGRIPFYFGATGGSSKRPDYADLNGDDADRLRIRERFETIDQDIQLDPGVKETITFEFNENIQDDFFVFKAVYSDGTRATYYIDAPKSTGSNNGNPTGGTSADQVAYADSLSGTSSGQLIFDIENTGTTGVTVTGFSISDQSTSDRIEKGNPSDTGSAAREVEITGGLTDGFADGDNGYTTDGTAYSLDADAVISGGGTATIDLEEFVTTSPPSSVDLSGVQQKNTEASADITVTLRFSDGSSKEFYFKT